MDAWLISLSERLGVESTAGPFGVLLGVLATAYYLSLPSDDAPARARRPRRVVLEEDEDAPAPPDDDEPRGREARRKKRR